MRQLIDRSEATLSGTCPATGELLLSKDFGNPHTLTALLTRLAHAQPLCPDYRRELT